VRLFFYGTLLDPDVQSLVLGRALGTSDLIPAVLRHFRCVYIAGRTYPMVLPHRGGAVKGAVAMRLSRDDLARIAHYEGSDYRLERYAVWPLAADQPAAKPIFAWLYRSRPDIRPSTREWRLSAWQAKDKTLYLRAARVWLAERAAAT
jgi:hypothetical protein